MNNEPAIRKSRTSLNCSNMPEKQYAINRTAEWVQSSINNFTLENEWEQVQNLSPPTPCVSLTSDGSLTGEFNEYDHLLMECKQNTIKLQLLLAQRQELKERLHAIHTERLVNLQPDQIEEARQFYDAFKEFKSAVEPFGIGESTYAAHLDVDETNRLS